MEYNTDIFFLTHMFQKLLEVDPNIVRLNETVVLVQRFDGIHWYLELSGSICIVLKIEDPTVICKQHLQICRIVGAGFATGGKHMF